MTDEAIDAVEALNENNDRAPRDRSPAFPFISLQVAIERLALLDQKFGRHPTPFSKIGIAWGMKESSSTTMQTAAALKYYGLIDYEGSGDTRKVFVTEDGRNYLRAQQDEIKKSLLKKFALNPKEIAKYWAIWGADRPYQDVCLDTLVIHNKYNEKAAPQFLKVYDATIAYAGLSNSDKIDSVSEVSESVDEQENQRDNNKQASAALGIKRKGPSLMDGERVLEDGMLSQNANYRVIVSGKVGPKEMDRLIKKMEVIKEILSETEEDDGSDLV